MHPLLVLFLYFLSMLFLRQVSASDEKKTKAFFQNNLQLSAERYLTSRIERSLSERFWNVEIDITDLDGDDTRFPIFTVQPLYDNANSGRATYFQGSP